MGIFALIYIFLSLNFTKKAYFNFCFEKISAKEILRG